MSTKRNASAPEIAVVIPTRRREARLAFALEALAAQTLEPERFEVHVVRAAEDADAPTIAPPAGLPVHFNTAPAPSVTSKRNVGWRTATAPLVAFTDDDCRPRADWLERLLEAHAAAGGMAVLQGRTDPDPDEAHLDYGLARTVTVDRASGWYETCNIAYPRELLERLGGFDESITFMGEDTDLGMRARALGAELRYVDDALVWHAIHWRSLPGAIRDARRRASAPWVVAKYPELKDPLFLRVFTDLNHFYLLVAYVGLIAARFLTPLAALAALPYVRRHFDFREATPWRLLRLPTQVLSWATVDTAEMTAFAVSSLRNGTLIL